MSVKKLADEVVDQMRKDVDAALVSTNKAFTAICVEKCWGADEWNAEFKVKLMNAQKTLLELQDDLGPRRYLDEW